MYGLRLITILSSVLAIAFAGVLVNIYLDNYKIFHQSLTLYGNYQIRIGTLLLAVFLLGFFLNLLYNVYMGIRNMMRGLNASAATRAGKRISSQLQDARNLLSHGLTVQAREALEALLKERQDYTPASLLLGEVYLKQGDTDHAVKHLENLCLAKPELLEAKYQLAEALLASRDTEGAVTILKQIAGDHPKLALRALRRLRALHAEVGRWEEALEVHKRLMTRFQSELNQAERSQGTALLYQVGLTQVEADQYKEAAQTFQQVLKEDGNFVPAYLSLGHCMILQDQEAQGMGIWQEGFRTTGEGALLQEIEDYFIHCGKPEEGLAVLQRIAATSEHQTTAKFFLGKMFYRLEILDEALDLFQEVRAQVVYSPILYFFMAKIHARRGRNTEALNEYRQLLRNLGVLRLRFECSVCGQKTADYADRCEQCGSWNSHHFMFKENEMPELPMRPESGSWLAMI